MDLILAVCESISKILLTQKLSTMDFILAVCESISKILLTQKLSAMDLILAVCEIQDVALRWINLNPTHSKTFCDGLDFGSLRDPKRYT